MTMTFWTQQESYRMVMVQIWKEKKNEGTEEDKTIHYLRHGKEAYCQVIRTNNPLLLLDMTYSAISTSKTEMH